MTAIRAFLAILAFAVFAPAGANAHALQPGYLEIKPLAGDSYRVFWRRPDVQGAVMSIDARLPENCAPIRGPEAQSDGSAWVSVWVAECPGGLTDGTITIEGLDTQKTDVLVRYEAVPDHPRSERLTLERTSFTVPDDPGAFDVIRSYLPLGIEHILAGIDHLLFVFALLLLIPDRWRLVGAITAFTVAHSITMAVATLGWVALPGPPVEAIIALSIMFLASELVQRDGSNQRLSERYPWTVSFSFGLLHGFGFAGALREIGLPQTDVPLALLSFNIGVEIGQLLFVVAVLIAAFTIRRLAPWAAKLIAVDTRGGLISAYAIGGISSYWFIDRLSGF
ncbi:MAG: HupE/UreJ family protein [Tateyamaria sp.]|uniref:HupE/UreJ family protein n=1 Tax=Tateyamaria sp. TaxID=1929288 RepID=UPI0032930AA7